MGVQYGGGRGPSFLGQEAGQSADYSQETASIIDEEVKQLVMKQYRRAKDLLMENMDVVHDVAAVLMEKENIDGDEFERICLKSRAKLYLKEDNAKITVP